MRIERIQNCQVLEWTDERLTYIWKYLLETILDELEALVSGIALHSGKIILFTVGTLLQINIRSWSRNCCPPVMLIYRILLIYVDFEKQIMLATPEILVSINLSLKPSSVGLVC